MKTNISVFITGLGTLTKKPEEYTTAELNMLWKQEIIEKFSLENFIKRINTGLSDSLYNSTVILRHESPRKVICLRCGTTEAWINPNK